jgi:uncharacterized cofD-like protein
MALAALCGDDRWGQTWARVLQHRFSSVGDLDGHAMGNLLIVSLWELLGDHVLGLDWVGGLLGAHGRVLPMATTPMDITADVRTGPGDATTRVRGQVEVATSTGVQSVQLDPPDPPACPDAVVAIGNADLVVLGPGSWFTSVLPHLLVPGLRRALEQTTARIVVTMNLLPESGETAGLAPADHIDVLRRHAPELRIDTVLADEASVPRPDALAAAAERWGGRVVLADVADPDRPGQHDPGKLASAYARLIEAT